VEGSQKIAPQSLAQTPIDVYSGRDEGAQ
jgi:hypothetical protein